MLRRIAAFIFKAFCRGPLHYQAWAKDEREAMADSGRLPNHSGSEGEQANRSREID